MKNKLKELLYRVIALAATVSSLALLISSFVDLNDFRCNNEIVDGINAIYRLILSISVNRMATGLTEELDKFKDTK